MSWLHLESSTAVVTGAGSGIGRGVALELARAGARVAVLDPDAAAAQETSSLIATAIGGKALDHRCDTTDAEQVAVAADVVRRELGPVEILVNHAPIISVGPLLGTSIVEWQRDFDAGVRGYLLCSHAFGADMLDRGAGSVVHISSICGPGRGLDLAGFAAGENPVTLLSRRLAAEWAGAGVRSNAVAPGLLGSSAVEVAPRDHARRTGPLRRIGSAQDIANAVVWLASPRSGRVTGQAVLVDGGLTQTLALSGAVGPSR